jgi:hypothetical protein
MLTVALGHRFFENLALFLNVQEDLLSNLCMPLGASPPEVIEPNIKPFIHLRVNFVVMVANLPRSLLLLHRLHLSSRSVLVSTADVQHVRPLQFLEARVDVRRKDATDNISKVGHVVDIGQG